MRRRIALVAVALGLALAGCGGKTSDPTADAAKCLRNAVAQDALHDSGGNCNDPSAVDAMGGDAPKATCTKQNGNQYVCDVKGGTAVRDGFYDVTYDGKSIVYQPHG